MNALTQSLKLKKIVKTAQKEKKAEREKELSYSYNNGNNPKKHMGLSTKRAITNTIAYIVLIAISLIWLIPFFCIFCESFRCESTWQVGYVIPQKWGFDNYVNLFTNTNFPRWFMNTFITALFVSVFQTLFVLSYELWFISFKI